MDKKPKTKPPRKTAAKKAAKSRAGARKAATKGASGGKSVSPSAKTPAKRAKPKNIFAKTKTVKPRRKQPADASKSSIAINAPLLEALDGAYNAPPPEPLAQDQEMLGDRRGGYNFQTGAKDQGRPLAWRSKLGEQTSEAEETTARINKLVPTNALHTTKRRVKRNTWQGPVLGFGALAVFAALLAFGNNDAPQGVSPLEYRAEVVDTAETPFPAKPSGTSMRTAEPKPREQQVIDTPSGLKVLELVEMERMLAQLDMAPSQADGVVDSQTETAIRMYQQIAGLTVDGEPSAELLDDMREVVKMMDGVN